MAKPLLFLFVLIAFTGLRAQEPELPPDFRQYNLNQYNSSLFNPVFSLDRNHPQSLSLWVRWQWQMPDADPTTVFANYTHRLNRRSALGVGFLQQNTSLFLQTGGVLNYAYALDLSPDLTLSLGLNLFGFQQELADDRFQQGPNVGLPFLDNGKAFVVQAAPGISLGYKNFNLGLTAENLLEYNLTEKDRNNGSDEKIFLGSASYAFDIPGSGLLEDASLRPMVYVKTIPELDTQFGINTLFSTRKLWVQGGYHNFYGISGGIGGTFFNRLSVGVLAEVGTSSDLSGKDPSFELVTSYHFAAPDLRKKVVGFDVEQETAEVLEPEKEKKLSRRERRALALAEQQKLQDSILVMRKQQDSLMQARKRAAEDENARLATDAQHKKDSLEAIAAIEAEKERDTEVVIPRKGERYEEAVLSEDIRPGYYLIVNVFGTEKYYNLFMGSLKKRGLEPKSFYRTGRKLNYVYLERYNSISEAREARDSKFYGQYSETIWIFRVKGE